MALARQGISIKRIVRETGHSRGLVRQVVRGHRTDVFRVRQSTLEAHLPWLDAQWESGCRKGAELWRRLRARGYGGSERVVREWATRRRRAETVTDHQMRKVPSARTIARLLTIGPRSSEQDREHHPSSRSKPGSSGLRKPARSSSVSTP